MWLSSLTTLQEHRAAIAYLAPSITMSSKVLLIVSYMLCFVSLLQSHLIKWFQREYNLETANEWMNFDLLKEALGPSSACFDEEGGGSQNSASVLPLEKGQSISPNLQWGCRQ